MIKVYMLLTKPGIVLGNLMAAIGGFVLAYGGSGDPFNWVKLACFGLSTALIIGSAGIINNYVDRNIDARMERTKRRAFVAQTVSVSKALALATLMVVVGFMLLFFGTSKPAFYAGIVGFVGYLIPYGLAKRHGPYGTIVGSIPGAIPPLAGYLSVKASLDWTAFWLFVAMVFWQMPHFYAIAMRRLDDYKNAHIPVLPAVKGVKTTVRTSLIYILLFWLAAVQIMKSDKIAIIYQIVMFYFVLRWFMLGYIGKQQDDMVIWARKFMKASVRVLLAWSLLMIVLPLF